MAASTNLPSLLHVEVITAPNIINDKHTPNSFTIGVFNQQLTKDVVLDSSVSLHFWFVVDDGPAGSTPKRPWGLTSKDLLKNATAYINNHDSGWTVIQDDTLATLMSDRPDLGGWKATPKTSVTLPAGHCIQFTIEGLVSALPDGYTTPSFCVIAPDFPKVNDYDNVNAKGDYKGDNWVFLGGSILKSPIVANRQQVGIGTDKPRTQLEIKSADSVGVLLNTTGSRGQSALTLKTKNLEWLLGVNDATSTSAPIARSFFIKAPTKNGPGDQLFSIDQSGTAYISNNLYLRSCQIVDGALEIQKVKIFDRLDFFAEDGQKVNFEGAVMGIGTQNGGMYLRTGSKYNFNIYQGGSHSDISNDAGGGRSVLSIDANGKTSIKGDLAVDGAQTVNGNVSINGALTLQGQAPFEFQVFTFNMRADQNYGNQIAGSTAYNTGNQGYNGAKAQAWVPTGRKQADYTPVVAGWQIQNLDLDDSMKHDWAITMGAPDPIYWKEGDDGSDEIWIHIQLGVDQWQNYDPQLSVVVNALFIRKSLVKIS